MSISRFLAPRVSGLQEDRISGDLGQDPDLPRQEAAVVVVVGGVGDVSVIRDRRAANEPMNQTYQHPQCLMAADRGVAMRLAEL